MTERNSESSGILQVVLINLVVFCIAAGAIETAVRLFNPEISAVGTDKELFRSGTFGHSAGPRPGATGRSNGVMRRVDDRGFWAYSGARPTKPKWLLLGDSVTMGLGVEGDSTYAGILAAAQDSLDVVSASVPGHASDDYLAIARVLADSMDIRRISVFWCLNDVMAGRPVDNAPTGTRVLDNRMMAFVRRYVRTYTWAKSTFTDRPKRYYLHDSALYEERRGYLEAALTDLGELSDLATAHGIPLEVILLPYEYGLRTGEHAPRRLMADRLGALDIRVRDAGPELLPTGDPAHLYLYGDGIHFNRRGHRAIAEFVLGEAVGE